MTTTNNRITDQSNDRKYFTQMPNIVLAKCRNPQDIALWITIKMVAGEQGECFLSTEDLAELATMSVGKAADCRKFLISAGLIVGEIRRDEGYPQPVWHLTIPDLWDENIAWCKQNHSLKDKIRKRKEFKAQLINSNTLRTTTPKEVTPEDEKSLHNVTHKEPSYCEGGISQNEGGISQNEAKNNNERTKITSSAGAKFEQKPQPPAAKQPAVKVEDDEGVIKFISYFKAKKQAFTTPNLQAAIVMAVHTYGADRAIELYDEALMRGATDLPSYVLTLARNNFERPKPKPQKSKGKLTPELAEAYKRWEASCASV